MDLVTLFTHVATVIVALIGLLTIRQKRLAYKEHCEFVLRAKDKETLAALGEPPNLAMIFWLVLAAGSMAVWLGVQIRDNRAIHFAGDATSKPCKPACVRPSVCRDGECVAPAVKQSKQQPKVAGAVGPITSACSPIGPDDGSCWRPLI